MTNAKSVPIFIAVLVLVPLMGTSSYLQHLLTIALINAIALMGWSIMGRYNIISLGHGAFFGISAYAMALLWNHFGLSPWIGIPIGILLSIGFALVIAWPSFRFGVTGHYFALVTLAAGEIVRLAIIAWRDTTGGSLGLTPTPAPDHPWLSMQLGRDMSYFLVVGFVALGFYIWHRLDKSRLSQQLEAVADDESAASAIGINVLRVKLTITALSAGITALAGALLAQYKLYLNPELLTGLSVSLYIIFGAILGGIYSPWGAIIGAAATLILTEGLRIIFGTTFLGAANTVYGLVLIVVIIVLPTGLFGLLKKLFDRQLYKTSEIING